MIQDGLTYTDTGEGSTGELLSKDIEYCYYVTTYGSYGNDSIPDPLINLSQIDCARPNDTIPPCAPSEIVFTDFNSADECETFLLNKPCNYSDFSNSLSWRATFDEGCDQEIRTYKIYYSRTGEEGSYEVIAEERDTFYVHQNLPSFAGCYRISAIDRSGNESEWSEPLCKDNCPMYELPNIFTPNGDEYNQFFSAYNDEADRNCPRFIEEVKFRVYNRWGSEVYNSATDPSYEPDILINWDGETNTGEPLSSGVYYYLAEITYISLNPTSSTYKIKGWVQLMK